MRVSPFSRKVAAVLACPASSDWLKQALVSSLDRDPVDALSDASALRALLSEREREAQAEGAALVPPAPGTWEARVRALEAEGLDRSDAQGAVDAEDLATAAFLPDPMFYRGPRR